MFEETKKLQNICYNTTVLLTSIHASVCVCVCVCVKACIPYCYQWLPLDGAIWVWFNFSKNLFLKYLIMYMNYLYNGRISTLFC